MSSVAINSTLWPPKTSGFTLIKLLSSTQQILSAIAKDPYDQRVKIRSCLASDSKSLTILLHETEILRLLPGSPQFPKLLHSGFYSDSGQIPKYMLITEFIEGLSLMDISKPIISAKRRGIEQSLMDAVYLLKTKNLVHSDIKPGHIIVRGATLNDSPMLAAQAPTQSGSEIKITLIDFKHAGQVGTPRTSGLTRYLRPGVLPLGDPLNFEDDRYSAEASIEVLCGLNAHDKRISPPYSLSPSLSLSLNLSQAPPSPIAGENPFI